MKSALAFIRSVAVKAALASAALIASAPQAAAQRDNFWMEIAIDQAEEDAGPGLVSSLIDYASLRLAMEAKPDVIRARIAACGSCKDRAVLERDLAIAERDRQAIAALEAFIGKEIYNLEPWEGWKRGLKIRPDAVMKGPAACIPLYDRYMNCAVPSTTEQQASSAVPATPKIISMPFASRARPSPSTIMSPFSIGEYAAIRSPKPRAG